MNCIRLPFAIAAATFAAQFPLLAQPLDSSSIASGRQVATALCANCHEISPTAYSTTVVGPKFDAIANLPSTTALSLNVFLHSNHNRMPNFILSGPDTNNVITYILSLKRK